MLYVIPTPIGNKDDITVRALKLFESINVFLCEDTQTSKKLFGMYEIQYKQKQFFTINSFVSGSKLDKFKELIAQQDVGVMSEAGTP
jgi:16S rRNA (cytidine1402-2'-O)-methyltransferase